jgi:hypothetical protein
MPCPKATACASRPEGHQISALSHELVEHCQQASTPPMKVLHGGETAKAMFVRLHPHWADSSKSPAEDRVEIIIPAPAAGLSCPLQRQPAVLDSPEQARAQRELQSTAPACSESPLQQNHRKQKALTVLPISYYVQLALANNMLT